MKTCFCGKSLQAAYHEQKEVQLCGLFTQPAILNVREDDFSGLEPSSLSPLTSPEPTYGSLMLPIPKR